MKYCSYTKYLVEIWLFFLDICLNNIIGLIDIGNKKLHGAKKISSYSLRITKFIKKIKLFFSLIYDKSDSHLWEGNMKIVSRLPIRGLFY